MSFLNTQSIGGFRVHSSVLSTTIRKNTCCAAPSRSLPLLSVCRPATHFSSTRDFPTGPGQQRRWKKTKSSVSFDDLLHGSNFRPAKPSCPDEQRNEIKAGPIDTSVTSFEHVENTSYIVRAPHLFEPGSLEGLSKNGLQQPVESEEIQKAKRTRKVSSVRLESLSQGLIDLDKSESSITNVTPFTPEPKEPSDGYTKNLHQGLISLEPLEFEDESPSYPTVVMQARKNMQNFENCVVITRVGGFYELYFDHADEFGPPLGLKVSQKKTNAGPVSMAGFPFHQLDRYLKILVQDLNRNVAISEEYPNDVSAKVKSGGLMHDRRVSRIITPGTLIDENFMDPLSNNYVLAIHIEDGALTPSTSDLNHDTSVGLAWLDLSTGQFFTQKVSLTEIPSFLARVSPREIVLDQKLEAHNHILGVFGDDRQLIAYAEVPDVRPIEEWSAMLESPVPPSAAGHFTEQEIAAGSCLLYYIGTRLQGSDLKLQPPVRQLDLMGIDKNTMRALEIKKTIREDNFSGSLLHTVRRTATKGGARLLENWLGAYLEEQEKIVLSNDLNSFPVNFSGQSLRERITTLLKRSHDSHRLLQKFAFGRGDADDLLALATTIHATRDLVELLAQEGYGDPCVQALLGRVVLEDPMFLAESITAAIDEDGLIQQHRIEDTESGEMQALAEAVVASEGTSEDTSTLRKTSRKKTPNSIREYYNQENEAWTMKTTATPTLRRLHKRLNDFAAKKAALETSLCERLGVASLTLRFTPGLGHICHVKGRDINLSIPEARTISSSKSTKSLHHPEWSALGQEIDQCRTHIRAEEQRLFYTLREQAITNLVKLRRNAAVLDEIDLACSFAILAEERGWTRPILNTGSTHKIIGGRHPTVEGGLEEEGRSFISNDCIVGDVDRAWMITGPNMAGKSTFLRQNALITILAQVGSYVPAQYAELGIVDHIFSRVGSADDLYRDQSTFMVEMLESAAILENATSRSFVIMDEIGRGTTPADGIAVAFACLHHLYHVNKCRTLFATHFHALADLIPEYHMEDVGFYCTDVEEDESRDGVFRYRYKLRQGINKHSHALKVAKLAGLPKEAIEVARQVLKKM
ncbi:domain V protein [Rutstroemia sp. NJR-2017a WRK4]|nr:domain V protein [Rutstroemia sp. NJR-2017a WRK4]